MKNLYITFEGVDCSGKSTLIKALAKKMSDNKKLPKGVLFKALHENPNRDADDLSYLIRNRMNNNHATTDALILMILLNDLEKDKYRNSILEQDHLLQDRSYISSIVYGGCKSICTDVMYGIVDMNKLPDLFIFVDAKPDVIMERIKNENLFDSYTPVNIDEVCEKRDLYIKALSKYTNVVTVSGENVDEDIESIERYVMDAFNIKLIEEKGFKKIITKAILDFKESDFLNHWVPEGYLNKKGSTLWL